MIFKTGDIIRVNEEPRSWASYFCDRCPINSGLKYPIMIRIIEIEVVEHHTPIRATCLEDDNDYGFDYDELINNSYTQLNKSKGFMNSCLIKELLKNG